MFCGIKLDTLINNQIPLLIHFDEMFKPFIEKGRTFKSLVYRKEFVFDGEKFIEKKAG